MSLLCQNQGNILYLWLNPLNTYAHEYRKYKLMVCLFHALLPATAIPAGIYRDKNSTFRPSLQKVSLRFLPLMHCGSQFREAYQPRDSRGIPRSQVLQNLLFFKCLSTYFGKHINHILCLVLLNRSLPYRLFFPSLRVYWYYFHISVKVFYERMLYFDTNTAVRQCCFSRITIPLHFHNMDT